MRHALEPAHDPHKLEKHRFMAVLATTLDAACGRCEFDDLVLVAPRRSLGELRGLLSRRVLGRVRAETARDLTKEPVSRLRQRLGAVLGERTSTALRAGRRP